MSAEVEAEVEEAARADAGGARPAATAGMLGGLDLADLCVCWAVLVACCTSCHSPPLTPRVSACVPRHCVPWASVSLSPAIFLKLRECLRH